MHTVCPESGQHSGRELPLPHSQQPLASTYDLQRPAAQIWLVPQAVPQTPQWVGSVWVSTQAAPVLRPEVTEHAVSPAPQDDLHPPAWQSLLLPKSAGHELLHALQLKGSVCRLVQVEPHRVSPGGQAATQAPLEHVLPPGHCVEQLPQNCGSVLVATHALPPLMGVHAVEVAASQVTPQPPPAHAGAPVAAPETGSAQALAQAPQFCVSVCSSKQPAGHLLVKPGAWQRKPQLPTEHTAVPSAGAVQVVPQPPQLARSLEVSTQAPPHAG